MAHSYWQAGRLAGMTVFLLLQIFSLSLRSLIGEEIGFYRRGRGRKEAQISGNKVPGGEGCQLFKTVLQLRVEISKDAVQCIV